MLRHLLALAGKPWITALWRTALAALLPRRILITILLEHVLPGTDDRLAVERAVRETSNAHFGRDTYVALEPRRDEACRRARLLLAQPHKRLNLAVELVYWLRSG